jgi:predicted MFS family arabinose efflux permease
MGLITAFDNPARQTFIFEMVGKDNLKNAVSLNATMVNFARIIGPTIAGILVPTIGLAACFLFNGISFIAVLFVLFLMNASQLQPVKKVIKTKGQLKEGFAYVRATPAVRNVLIIIAIVGTFTFEFQVILPLFAAFTFKSPTAGFALLTSAMGLGAVIGGLYAAGRKKTSMKSLIINSFLFGLSVLIASLAPNIQLAAIAMIFVGFASINFTSLANSILQIKSAPEMRGRVMALWGMAFLGSTPIGGPIIGYIGEHIGPRYGLAVGGFAAMIAAIIIFFLQKRDQEQTIPTNIKYSEEQAIADKQVSLR